MQGSVCDGEEERSDNLRRVPRCAGKRGRKRADLHAMPYAETALWLHRNGGGYYGTYAQNGHVCQQQDGLPSRARMRKLIVFAASVTSVNPETKCQADRGPKPIIPTIGVQNVLTLRVPPAEHNETSRTVLYAGKIKHYSYRMGRQREYGTAEY
jgi:hypothetical protein